MLDLKIVCGWCSIVIKNGIEPVSHGICAHCSKQYFGEMDPIDYVHTLCPEVCDEQEVEDSPNTEAPAQEVLVQPPRP